MQQSRRRTKIFPQVSKDLGGISKFALVICLVTGLHCASYRVEGELVAVRILERSPVMMVGKGVQVAARRGEFAYHSLLLASRLWFRVRFFLSPTKTPTELWALWESLVYHSRQLYHQKQYQRSSQMSLRLRSGLLSYLEANDLNQELDTVVYRLTPQEQQYLERLLGEDVRR